MKIGIFSGTFDPIHEGHTWLARRALEQFQLDKVVLLPEKKPRRKFPIASYEHRKTMLSIATLSNPKLDVLDVAVDSHTVIKTLNFVRQHYDIGPEKIEVIMGMDVFKNIGNWQDFDYLKKKTNLMVCLMNDNEKKSADKLVTELAIKTQFVKSNYPHLSSSKIRSMLTKYKIPDNINQEVYKYIRDNKLYETK